MTISSLLFPIQKHRKVLDCAFHSGLSHHQNRSVVHIFSSKIVSNSNFEAVFKTTGKSKHLVRMMSHSDSEVMLFSEMDSPAEGQFYDSGLGSLPNDSSLGLALSQLDLPNDEDLSNFLNLLEEDDEEGMNRSRVGVDEVCPEAAGYDAVQSHLPIQHAVHDLSDDHNYGGNASSVAELVDSDAEDDCDDSPLRSCDVSNRRRVISRVQRPKRAAALKKRAVSICSDTSEDVVSTKIRQTSADRYGSLSKNAIAARENREKKKQYVLNLERNLEKMEAENSKKDALIETYKKNQEALVTEVNYLRGCLANSAEISAVIKSVKNNPNLQQVTTSLGLNSKNQESRKRCLRSENEENEECPARKSRRLQQLTGTEKAGICVHVSDGAVSLEFCSQCHRSARIAAKR